MKILVTAGNTQTPIDLVRCITNIFTGKTGARIALESVQRQHETHLLTSHPEVVAGLTVQPLPIDRWRCITYRTFEDLELLMEQSIRAHHYDCIIHAAAVSDYKVDSIHATAPKTHATAGASLDVMQQVPAKIKSHHAELWLKLVPTVKLIDKIRPIWGFRGTLVKFKLEANLTDQELIEQAEKARLASQAEIIVANNLDSRDEYAFMNTINGTYQKITRTVLPAALLDNLEKRHLPL